MVSESFRYMRPMESTEGSMKRCMVSIRMPKCLQKGLAKMWRPVAPFASFSFHPCQAFFVQKRECKRAWRSGAYEEFPF